MTGATTAREEILRRIAAANGGLTSLPEAKDAWSGIAREYRRAASLSREDILLLLEERLRDYDAVVERSPAGEVVAKVQRTVEQRGNPRMLMPPGMSHPLPANFTVDENFSPRELDRFDGVVTEATLAIAETGTLVLRNVPGQGRRAATLVPDFHLCILRAGDVVETVPEAMDRLVATAALPTTFVSGPSATADIEMTRIKGVHGPRFLHVILVE